MTSLAPIRPPSSSSSRSPTPNSSQTNTVFRHQHSLSSSTPANQHFGALSPHYGGARSAGGPRQSLDASKSPIGGAGPISPRLPPSGNPIRPNSEMLGVGNQQMFGGPSLEAEAIDKWFEDLQSYEATLEEMAAASLDVNFKEELSAIEQWFRVLSEAERTAALYSLLQSSTQVQIRFFITVLQQMARSDPMTALLSPAPTGGAASMEQQMEAKLAQLSMKSPASPAVRQFARQSLGNSINNTLPNEPYLSPSAALLTESTNSNGASSPNDPATLLATQRAKLNANAANRVSAPGHLLGDHALKSPKWSHFSGTVEEEEYSRSPSPRPKSTGSDLNTSVHNASQAAFNRAAASVGAGLDSQLSPILGGNWASQVNTPLVPMFTNKDDSGHPRTDTTTQGLGDAANRLAQWGAAHQAGGSHSAPSLAPGTQAASSEAPPSGIQLDDARKFRRQSKIAVGGGSSGFSGVLSGMGASAQNSPSSNSQSLGSGPAAPKNNSSPSNQSLPNRPAPQNLTQSLGPSNATRATVNTSISSNGLPSPMAAQSLLGAQQAAMAAQQNWRNGLSSPNTMNMSSSDPNVVNNLAMMNTLAGLNAGGINMNGMANLAAMANINDPAALQNMANLLNMRQQMQQVQNLQALQQQLQQNGMMNGMMNGGGLLSPVSGRIGMNFGGFPMMGGMANMGNKRSPGGRSPSGKPSHTPGSGSNPEEELDMKLLSDIPSWLRGLRLHKYTPNFEGCTWQEMVLMSDGDLEARGVAAVGARRKMLRTFETVRIKKGMALPGDGASNTEGAGKPSMDSNVSSHGGSDKDSNKA